MFIHVCFMLFVETMHAKGECRIIACNIIFIQEVNGYLLCAFNKSATDVPRPESVCVLLPSGMGLLIVFGPL